jgi:four helix bundle protein
MPFLFEKLSVYQKALSWAGDVDNLLDSCALKKSHPVYDQLGRAALSIPLNIAEGNGRWHPKEKKQFFMFARGSVLECVAMIQVMKLKDALNEKLYSKSYLQLEEIAKMLSGLIQSIST